LQFFTRDMRTRFSQLYYFAARSAVDAISALRAKCFEGIRIFKRQAA